MKKNIVLIVVLIIFTLGALGCSNKNKISIDDLNASIKKVTDMSNMKKENSEKLKKLYGIEENKLDGFMLYKADSNIKADEILIIKLKNKDDADDYKNKINKRIDKQEVSFKDYLPKEYDLLKHSILKSKDNFIIFVVSKDADKIEEAFDKRMN